MIKTVFIDIDNTVLDFNKCAAWATEKVFADFDLPFSKKTIEVFREVNEGMWHKIEKGSMSRAELFENRWSRTLEKLGIDFDGHVVEKHFFAYLTEAAEPVEGAVELLEYLAQKYNVCVTSNAGYDQQIRRLENAGMLKYISKAFISEKIGFSKPDKGFFDACFAELTGISPVETMIIGDSLTADIRGGILYGIKTCWYNHNHEKMTCKIRADYTVDSLLDIKKIL